MQGTSDGISAEKGYNPMKKGFDLGVAFYTKLPTDQTLVEKDEEGWSPYTEGINSAYG